MDGYRAGHFQYRCRRCGALYASRYLTGDAPSVLQGLIEGKQPGGVYVETTELHVCADGNGVGISDLAGVLFQDNPSQDDVIVTDFLAKMGLTAIDTSDLFSAKDGAMVDKCKFADCVDDCVDGSYCESHAAMFEYLDELRDSGDTNMFGAGPYVADEFGLSKAEARIVLRAWMETYGQRHGAQS